MLRCKIKQQYPNASDKIIQIVNLSKLSSKGNGQVQKENDNYQLLEDWESHLTILQFYLYATLIAFIALLLVLECYLKALHYLLICTESESYRNVPFIKSRESLIFRPMRCAQDDIHRDSYASLFWGHSHSRIALEGICVKSCFLKQKPELVTFL